MNGGDFEGGMEDIEVPRNPKGIDFGDVGAVADNDSLQVWIRRGGKKRFLYKKFSPLGQ